MPKVFVFKDFRFLFLSKTRKTKKPQFFIGFFRLLMEFMTDVVRLSGVRLANE